MDIAQLKQILSRFNIKPNKTLGQNFLLSEKVLDDIITAADLSSDDTVLEIGPGLGILTRQLGDRAGMVIAVEKDRKLVVALRKIFSAKGGSASGGKNKKNVKIMQGDALFLDLSTFDIPYSTFKVVANIPYYITGKLLQNFLSPSPNPSPQGRGIPPPGGGRIKVGVKPSLMVLLLQKEVAQRIAAGPGKMSILSVSVQFYADPEIISFVSKDEFYPKPEVDSAVVKITPLSSPLTKGGKRGVRFDVDERKFFQLVKIGFAGKRKQLQNNLHNAPFAPSYLKRGEGELLATDYKQILSSLNINPLARAQDLSLQDWYGLYQKLLT
ncbi:MAG: ribosomal RNA small subunit methyltransferase A [Candidatus Doudnabacteria bacterium RIFCSPHIGHO2_01_FULL_46_14]|uniref:Ribosomal RNA small subunit methyltransferase A n=1 Tax=Candidatus Doudnabacteria bacterium RIFCSPHIGHO2_01_FULL_46_14 TaxID=1817824 RepID=A0A1F5NN84_9BACT|nr:MAG: ribosomal RNA small subunit methyltransferase A [Candidatus Doudnabacteria bacterium RIFCSPHIGHO2_01_FULL_46_14]